jgi:hypothetical protein
LKKDKIFAGKEINRNDANGVDVDVSFSLSQM